MKTPMGEVYSHTTASEAKKNWASKDIGIWLVSSVEGLVTLRKCLPNVLLPITPWHVASDTIALYEASLGTSVHAVTSRTDQRQVHSNVVALICSFNRGQQNATFNTSARDVDLTALVCMAGIMSYFCVWVPFFHRPP